MRLSIGTLCFLAWYGDKEALKQTAHLSSDFKYWERRWLDVRLSEQWGFTPFSGEKDRPAFLRSSLTVRHADEHKEANKIAGIMAL